MCFMIHDLEFIVLDKNANILRTLEIFMNLIDTEPNLALALDYS